MSIDDKIRFFALDGKDKRSFTIPRFRVSYDQLLLLSGQAPPLQIVDSGSKDVVVDYIDYTNSIDLLKQVTFDQDKIYEVKHVEKKEQVKETFVKVAELDELPIPTSNKPTKKKADVHGRHIILYRLSQDQYSAIDAVCYRK
eukprot:TRINITY_DN6914_c0_g1_i2.p1 TRINITY_DN6914_c0_g1~~TRINITY_DN6914_c0_g1_i2.p1  ORF type:complete len:142 (-),score=29.90 TRINITY_DN6914_c0_g1_i2:398-823(-)